MQIARRRRGAIQTSAGQSRRNVGADPNRPAGSARRTQIPADQNATVPAAENSGRVPAGSLQVVVALSDGEHAKALMFVSRANGAATGGPSRTLWPADRAVPVAAQAVLKRGPC